MKVVLHWGTGDVPGILRNLTPKQATVDVEGDDAPFVFDAVDDDRWIEHEWGGHAPIRITKAATGAPIQEGISC